MSEGNNEVMSTKANRKIWTLGIIGVVVGFLLCGIIIFMAMPSMMIVTKECKLGFDETVEALEKAHTRTWVGDIGRSAGRYE